MKDTIPPAPGPRKKPYSPLPNWKGGYLLDIIVPIVFILIASVGGILILGWMWGLAK